MSSGDLSYPGPGANEDICCIPGVRATPEGLAEQPRRKCRTLGGAQHRAATIFVPLSSACTQASVVEPDGNAQRKGWRGVAQMPWGSEKGLALSG